MPNLFPPRPPLLALALCALAHPFLDRPAAGLPLAAAGTPTVSIDFQGPAVGTLDRRGRPITEGHLLGAGSTRWPSAGLQPSPGGFVEVDALSFGHDPLPPTAANRVLRWLFSVDEFAVGGEASEAVAGAAATIFVARTSPDPIAQTSPETRVDEAGICARSFDLEPGLAALSAEGLVVEHAPTPRELPDAGDNIDALDGDAGAGHEARVFFSLDASFPDPLEPTPANAGTAVANGFVGGDVLIAAGSGADAPRVYARAAQLGLDADGDAFDIDDLDALVLRDDGDGVYQPVTGPGSWHARRDGETTDFLLFSVRRGSAVIGETDALLGLPIEEGDILVPVEDACDEDPLVDGRDCDFDPGIFVPAEALGLATMRSGTATLRDAAHGDDLDALDLTSVGGVALRPPSSHP